MLRVTALRYMRRQYPYTTLIHNTTRGDEFTMAKRRVDTKDVTNELADATRGDNTRTDRAFQPVTVVPDTPTDAGTSLAPVLGGPDSRIYFSPTGQCIDLGASPYEQSPCQDRYFGYPPHTLSGYPGAEMVTIYSNSPGSVGGRLLVTPPRWTSAVYRKVGATGGFLLWCLLAAVGAVVSLIATTQIVRFFIALSVHLIPGQVATDSGLAEDFLVSTNDRFMLLWFLPSVATAIVLALLIAYLVRFFWRHSWLYIQRVRAGLYKGYGRNLQEDMDYRLIYVRELKETQQWYKRQKKTRKQAVAQLRRGAGKKKRAEKKRIKNDVAKARKEFSHL